MNIYLWNCQRTNIKIKDTPPQQTKPYTEYNPGHNITIRSYRNVCFGTFHQCQSLQVRQASHRFEKHQVQHERVFPGNSDWISHQLAFQYVVTETNMIVKLNPTDIHKETKCFWRRCIFSLADQVWNQALT